jgi:hypothetical protein
MLDVGVKLGLSLCGKNRDCGVLENRVVTTIFGPQREEAGDCIVRNLMICTERQILVG